MARLYKGLEFQTIHQGTWSLEDLEGSVVLVVNTASECGFTPQYTGLEALHQQYGDLGLRVLAFPCDQFGQQEPGTDAEVHSFCESQYKITFPIHCKIDVNGKDAHPFYQRLKAECPGLLGSQRIKWNFTKFIIDKRGRPRKRYAPFTKPQHIESFIRQLLNEPTET